MKVVFTASADSAPAIKALQPKIKRTIITAHKDATKLLSNVEPDVTYIVQEAAWMAPPEVGVGGSTYTSKLILLSFDNDSPHNDQKLLKLLREAVFHEVNHAARYQVPFWHNTVLDAAIMEGLATVFERDKADSTPPWGKYKVAEVRKWLKEIRSLKGHDRWHDYFYKNPDGRRWIGYKTGTWIVDQAMHTSGKTIEELTMMDAKDILKLASLKDG